MSSIWVPSPARQVIARTSKWRRYFFGGPTDIRQYSIPVAYLTSLSIATRESLRVPTATPACDSRTLFACANDALSLTDVTTSSRDGGIEGSLQLMVFAIKPLEECQ